MESLSNQSDLSKLKLHEITETYGEQGLYDRLLLETDELPINAPDKLKVVYAADLARYIHDGQMRGPHPYSTHLFRVAARVIHHFEIKDPDIICACLLHDAPEDRPEKLSQRLFSNKPQAQIEAFSFITRKFNARTAGLVAAVTNPDFSGIKDTAAKNELYRHKVIESMRANPEARPIKLSDFIDNFGGLHYSESPDIANSLATKYRPLVPDLKRFAVAYDTPMSPAAKLYAYEALERAEQRCNELFIVK